MSEILLSLKCRYKGKKGQPRVSSLCYGGKTGQARVYSPVETCEISENFTKCQMSLQGGKRASHESLPYATAGKLPKLQSLPL